MPPFQICYGIIYGMGAKSLGEQMGITENDAACYIDSFKSRYTGKKSNLRILWLSTTLINLILQKCIKISVNQKFLSGIIEGK